MRHILIIISLFTGLQLHSQDIQKYISDFNTIVNNVPSRIYIRESCDKMINNLDDLSNDIDEILENNGDLSVDDKKSLKFTKTNAEALESFLRTVGNSSYVAGYLKERELSVVRQIINFSIAEVYAGKFCLDIYEVKFGSYICLVAFKNGGNDMFKILAQIKSNNGKAVSKMDMGLVSNQYRRIWSNASQLSNTSYQVTSVQCTVTGKSDFGF